MKKILVVGFFSNNSDVYTYATSFYKNFNDLGYDVEKFDYRQTYFCHFFLLFKVYLCKPDLIFFIKAETISYKIIKILKTRLCKKLVMFYPDNPFVFWNGNSNANILQALPFYDCFLIWSKKLIPVLKSAGCKKVFYFPFAFDQSIFATIPEQQALYDVCFVGTWDFERETWLKKLCNCMSDLNIAIWGNLWRENLPQNSVLRSFLKGEAVYGQHMIKVFRESKIVLNFIRIQNSSAHNMRTMEVPASKSFLLTQGTEEQAAFLFKDGESIACFSDIDELVSKIKFYLKNDVERERIVKNSFEKVQDYTMYKVLKKFMKSLESSSE